MISIAFFDLLSEFNMKIKERAALKVVNEKGESVSDKKYCVVRFDDSLFLEADAIFDPSEKLINDSGRLLIDSCILKHDIENDVFKVSNASSKQDPIFFQSAL